MMYLVREQEERIRNKRALSKDELLELWYGLGFTMGLEKNKALQWKVTKSLQNVYEFCSRTFTEGNSDERSKEYETLVLPLTRRILTRPEYDGHILEGHEIFEFVNAHTTADLIQILNEIRRGMYKPKYHERLESIDFEIVLKIMFELYGAQDKSLYDAIACIPNFETLSDREKHILKDIINLDYEAELTALIAEYFVYFNGKGNKTPENIKGK